MMKKIYSLMLSVPLLITASMTASVSYAQADTTNDYAYGAELILSKQQSMFSQISLDQQVYLQTLSPQLDDVRVFNRNGQIVPFSLINIYDDKRNTQEFAMTLYPLESQNQTVKNEQYLQVAINGKNVNINLDKYGENQALYTASYFLQVPEDITLDNSIANFKLQFADNSDNWQAKANIFYSRNLSDWSSAIQDVPLMTLTNDSGQSLQLNDISLPNYRSYKTQNWLINLQSQTPLPKLKQVLTIAQSSQTNAALVELPFTMTESTNQQAIYTLASPQPINKLQISLANTFSVLPVTIYYKQQQSDPQWTKLSEQIIRRVDYSDEETPLNLHNKLIQMIKLEANHSSFDTPPTLTAYRSKIDLIFNSANNGPFILAWGSAMAKAGALDATALLPSTENITDIPMAYYGESVKLGGESALTIQTTTSSSFAGWIIWAALIAGAIILIFLAIRLIKEVKTM